MINYFLGMAIVAIPFFIKIAPKTAPNISQEWLFALLTISGALFFGIRKSHQNSKVMAVGILISAFFAKDPFGIFQYYQMAMTSAGALFIALVYSHKKDINLKFIQACLGAVCIFESIWVLCNLLGLEPFDEWIRFASSSTTQNSHANIIIGSLGHINHSGALIAATLPFLKLIYWPLPVIVLVFSESSFPVICAVISAISLYSYKKGNFWPLVLGLFSLVMSALALISGNISKHSSYFSAHGRLDAWKKLWGDLGFQFTGKGFGYVPSEFSKELVGWEKFYQMHNEWVELYAISGLLGVGVALFLILPTVKNKGNPAINACLISLLVNSLGNFTFHMAPLFMVFGLCYALQLGEG